MSAATKINQVQHSGTSQSNGASAPVVPYNPALTQILSIANDFSEFNTDVQSRRNRAMAPLFAISGQEDTLNEQLISYAISGEVIGVKELLDMYEFSKEARGAAVVAASKRIGDLNPEFNEYSYDDFEPDFYDTLETLLQDGPISIEDRDKALINSANFRNGDMVELVLASGDVSQEARGKAVIALASDYRIGAMQLLLKKPISEEHRKQALQRAIDLDHPAVSSLLAARA